MPKPRNANNGVSSKQDIRSFFQLKKPKDKPAAVPVDLSDDDVIPESPDVQIKSKKKESRKKRVLSDSSDDEIFTNKKTKTEEKTPNGKKDKPLKEVKAVDLFGNGPIKRTEPLVKKGKKKTETGIHSDEEFEKSLLELDGVDVKGESAAKNNVEDEKSQARESKKEEKSKYFNGKSPKKDSSNKITKESKSEKDNKESKKQDVKDTDKSEKITRNDKNKESKESKHEDKRSEKKSTDSVISLDSDDESNHANKSEHKKKSNTIVATDKKKELKHEEKRSVKKLNDSIICIDSDDGSNHGKKSEHLHSESNNKKEKSHHKLTLNKDSDKTEKSPNKEKIKREKRDASPIKENIKSEKRDKSPVQEKIKSEKRDKTPIQEKIKSEKKDKPPIKEKIKSEKKRDFSEFIGDDDHVEAENEVKTKKKKLDQSLNTSVLSDEERHERKRHSAILYQNYKNRAGPKNLGAKEMPEGAPNCLKDCAFLLTGVLDSFERDEVAETIAKYGGCVKSGISKKVTHVIAGEEAGPAKLAKAQDMGIKILNEDEFLQMIRDRSNPKGKRDKSESRNDKLKNENNKLKSDNDKNHSKSEKNNETTKDKKKTKITPEKMKNFEDKIKNSFYKKSESKSMVEKPSSSKETITVEVKKAVSIDQTNETKKETSGPVTNSQMWVEKYKPQSVKQIIGQHGDASNVKKLINWLTKWYMNRKEKLSKPSPWAKNDDGAFFKAALLSGPPGVGKTTTVSLVCKELGFDTVEFNASDTRNKTLIREQIGELLTTTSLSGFAKGETNKKAVTKKHVLVMDEVDGMAGNEDRGGLQELIALIKTSAVPIICMCNDRNSEKMRTLVNYCYDLKFSRPRVDQIKSAMLSVCFKEGLKIPPDVLTQLITSCNQDIRQTLNSLSLWAVDSSRNDAASLAKDVGQTRKDMKLGPWEAVRKVFSAEDHKTMSIYDKSDLFFYDYSISPLFVQENYLSVAPHCPKDEVLKRISRAADSISCGDLVEARIRRSQAWSLLPVQAMYSSVIPGTELSGHVAGQIQFPGWLGKNSRANKMKRLAQEIHAHTRLSTTGSKSSIYLDYSKHLRDAIITPLIKDKTEGVSKSVEVLQAYSLLREDLDSLSELALWPGQRDPMVLVDSKVKAAMTRTYNKVALALPHSTASVSRARSKVITHDDDNGDDDDGDGEANDSEPENDSNIKVKKKTAAKSKDAEKPSTSKGDKGKKGKGKK